MIQSNELRIGNYVNCTYIVEEHNEEKDEWIDIPYTVIGKVTAIDSVNLTDHKIWVETTDCIEEFENIEPIPLTEDILLMCGFKEEKSYNLIKRYSRFEDEYVSFICAEYNEFMKRWIICAGNDNTIHVVALNSFEYLHHLQNLFYSLTGEELCLQL